jgi:hypothetical protein
MSVQTEAVDTDVAPARRASIRAGRIAFVVGMGLLAVLGLVLRLHLLTHLPVDGDESVAGLMADQILHGHFYTFFWGNQYGGGEFYLEALLFAVFGRGPVVLNGTGVLVTAAAAVLLWRAALKLVPPDRRWVAAAVATAFWVWPEAALWNSTREFGFRQLTMAAGTAAILLTLRMVEDWSPLTAVGAGLALGVGWWSSPEIVYFAVVPAVMITVVLLRGWDRTRLPALGLAVMGSIVGALPWFWTNLHTGFASLSNGSSPSYTPTTYVGRLSLFFHKAFPMMLNLRRPESGAWIGGRTGQALYLLSLLALAGLCLAGLWKARSADGLGAGACVVALLLFPFEYAAFPATSFWQDGHYGVFCVPLVLLVVAGSAPSRVRWPPALPVLALAATAAVLALSLSAYDTQFLPATGLSGLFRSGPNPNGEALAAIRGLESHHIRDAYADYWVAYNLDFLSQERLRVTDPSADRWAALYREVRASQNPAWIFYNPEKVGTAVAEFRSTNQGPFAYPEAVFLAKLAPLHVSYRIVHLGVLDAVVTSRAVRQEQVGMGEPLFP